MPTVWRDWLDRHPLGHRLIELVQSDFGPLRRTWILKEGLELSRSLKNVYRTDNHILIFRGGSGEPLRNCRKVVWTQLHKEKDLEPISAAARPGESVVIVLHAYSDEDRSFRYFCLPLTVMAPLFGEPSVRRKPADEHNINVLRVDGRYWLSQKHTPTGTRWDVTRFFRSGG